MPKNQLNETVDATEILEERVEIQQAPAPEPAPAPAVASSRMQTLRNYLNNSYPARHKGRIALTAGVMGVAIMSDPTATLMESTAATALTFGTFTGLEKVPGLAKFGFAKVKSFFAADSQASIPPANVNEVPDSQASIPPANVNEVPDSQEGIPPANGNEEHDTQVGVQMPSNANEVRRSQDSLQVPANPTNKPSKAKKPRKKRKPY